MSDLLDHAIKEKYNSMKINDPLIFVKNADVLPLTFGQYQ